MLFTIISFPVLILTIFSAIFYEKFELYLYILFIKRTSENDDFIIEFVRTYKEFLVFFDKRFLMVFDEKNYLCLSINNSCPNTYRIFSYFQNSITIKILDENYSLSLKSYRAIRNFLKQDKKISLSSFEIQDGVLITRHYQVLRKISKYIDNYNGRNT